MEGILHWGGVKNDKAGWVINEMSTIPSLLHRFIDKQVRIVIEEISEQTIDTKIEKNQIIAEGELRRFWKRIHKAGWRLDDQTFTETIELSNILDTFNGKTIRITIRKINFRKGEC